MTPLVHRPRTEAGPLPVPTRRQLVSGICCLLSPVLGGAVSACSPTQAMIPDTPSSKRNSMRTLYVLMVSFSEQAQAVVAKGSAEFHAHRARMGDFHARGVLLMSGAFQEPGQPLTTMGIFTSRDAAEDFAQGDPFVLNGVASKWEVHAWQDVLAEAK